MIRTILCVLFILASGIPCLRGVENTLESRVPAFAQSAAWVDGEKLLKAPENFNLLLELIPGIREHNVSKSDLAHDYLIFASADLRVYGMVIGKGKGELDKLHQIFSSNPDTLKLRYENGKFLTALWAKGWTKTVFYSGNGELLKLLKKEHTVSAASVVQLKDQQGESAKKLLEDFPELAHLSAIRGNAADKTLDIDIEFFFDNERSPAKGFRFLNWGLSFLLWRKTGAFRRIGQKAEKNVLHLFLADPPAEAIARRLVPKTPSQKAKRTSYVNLRLIASGICLYLADHQKKLPQDLNAVFLHSIADPSVFVSPADKKTLPAERGGNLKNSNTSYVYLLSGIEFEKIQNPSAVPMLMEKPYLLSPKRHRILVAFADGRVKSVKLPDAAKKSCREAVTELLKNAGETLSVELQSILLENASAWDDAAQK